jgi:hypothetical protein
VPSNVYSGTSLIADRTPGRPRGEGRENRSGGVGQEMQSRSSGADAPFSQPTRTGAQDALTSLPAASAHPSRFGKPLRPPTALALLRRLPKAPARPTSMSRSHRPPRSAAFAPLKRLRAAEPCQAGAEIPSKAKRRVGGGLAGLSRAIKPPLQAPPSTVCVRHSGPPLSRCPSSSCAHRSRVVFTTHARRVSQSSVPIGTQLTPPTLGLPPARPTLDKGHAAMSADAGHSANQKVTSSNWRSQ